MHIFKLGNLAKKRNHAWKPHGPKSTILETHPFFWSRNQYSSVHVVKLRDSEPETLESACREMEHVHKIGQKQRAVSVRNHFWDGYINSQKQRDHCSGRGLVFPPCLRFFAPVGQACQTCLETILASRNLLWRHVVLSHFLIPNLRPKRFKICVLSDPRPTRKHSGT